MSSPLPIAVAPILFLFTCLVVGCTSPTIPDDIADERLIDIGMPFERGMMAYLRGNKEVARTQLEAAVALNPLDARAAYLLCHLDYGSCYRESRDKQQEAEPPSPAVETVQQYLALVEARSPRIRNAVFAVVEQKMILEQKQYGVGLVLNVLLRFYPEAIFAMLTQRLVDLVEHPTRMSRQRATLLSKLASYVVVKDDVLTKAFNHYVDYGTATQQLHALRAELAAREHVIRITRLLIDTGYARRMSLLEAEAKRDKTLQVLRTIEARLISHRQSIADLAGIQPEQLSGLILQHLDLPKTDDIPVLRTSELEAIANQQYFESLDVSDTISLLSLTKVNLFASYGKNFVNERKTFVEGWATGVRFQVPLMIWPMGKARMAQQDAMVGKFETELEYSLMQARSEWLETYKTFIESSNLSLTALADTKLTRQKLASQQAARRAGAPGSRLDTVQAYISYYESLFRGYQAASKQQKAAFKWFRAQALSSLDIRFAPSNLSLADSCRLENRYVHPAERTLEIRESSSLTDAEKSGLLSRFANANGINRLVIPVSPALFRQHAVRYERILATTQAAGIDVLARVSFADGNGLNVSRANSSVVQFIKDQAKAGVRFDGLKLVLSGFPSGRAESNLLSLLADFREIGLPVVLELHWTALAGADTDAVGRLASRADKISIFLRPEVADSARKTLEDYDALDSKTYFTIDLGTSTSAQRARVGIEDLIQQNCRLFGHRRGLRELGLYAFEDYVALTPR